MRQSNYPGAEVSRLSGKEFTGECVDSLMELSSKGKPQTLDELNNRISDYFQFCSDKRFRPGVESLCLSMNISRMTFWNWRNGKRGEAWADACETALQQIVTFLEQAMLTGNVNPATGIFLLKNVAGYRDEISFSESVTALNTESVSADNLPRLIIDEE